MGTKPLGFTMVGVRSGDAGHASAARFTCSRCPETIDIRITGILNPEWAAKDARLKGWEAEAHNKTRCYCPKHSKSTRINDPNSELKKMEAKMPPVLPPAKTEVPLRGPTAEQRNRIRSLLDRWFDGDEGCYLEDWSDQKIAETASVARIVVERARDAAYGPILLTPELVSLRKEMAELKKGIENIDRAAASLAEQLQADLNGLRQKLMVIENKIAIVKAA